MEKFTIICKCGTALEVTPGDTGGSVFCTNCGERVEIPADLQAKLASIRASAPTEQAPGRREGSVPMRGRSPEGPPGGMPPYPGFYNEPKRTSGMAIASLVLSLLGLFSCGITALLGLIFGIVALKEISDNPNVEGKGLAIAGVIIGPIMILLYILMIVASIALPGIMMASIANRGMGIAFTLNDVQNAQQMYVNQYNTYGTFQALQAEYSLNDASMIEGGNRNGYTFFMDDTVTATGFKCIAMPVNPGAKALMIDESGQMQINTQSDGGGSWSTYDEYGF